VLREEVDLLEIELAEVVLAYSTPRGRGELDLEAPTEFLVLIARCSSSSRA
jgi:segregation and condensation protein A